MSEPKTCPACGTINHRDARRCDCGYSFVPTAQPGVEDRGGATPTPRPAGLTAVGQGSAMALAYGVVGAFTLVGAVNAAVIGIVITVGIFNGVRHVADEPLVAGFGFAVGVSLGLFPLVLLLSRGLAVLGLIIGIRWWTHGYRVPNTLVISVLACVGAVTLATYWMCDTCLDTYP